MSLVIKINIQGDGGYPLLGYHMATVTDVLYKGTPSSHKVAFFTNLKLE